MAPALKIDVHLDIGRGFIALVSDAHVGIQLLAVHGRGGADFQRYKTGTGRAVRKTGKQREDEQLRKCDQYSLWRMPAR